MIDQNRRLAKGGRIDRSRPMTFGFDGRSYSGLEGDTLASALLANGVTLVGRSFKYHRPRGVYSAGPEEPNALVTLGKGARREPNIPATTVELVDGLHAESQNRWPSLRFDVQAINSLFAWLLPAGFYYKTFMGPTQRAWMLYEHFIRRAAGLGRAGNEPDPDRYDARHEFCDIAVVGGGPAGLTAALAAGRSGSRTTLIEQDFLLGGALLVEPATGPAANWLKAIEDELRALSNVKILTRSTAFGLYDGGTIGIVERRDQEKPNPGTGRARQCLTMLRARTIVFATGAIERPLLFPDNDRPGVMLASAARSYLNRFAVLPGRRAVIVTNNDDGYPTAFDLAGAGASVVVADQREAPPPDLTKAASERSVEVRRASNITRIEGRQQVRAVGLRTTGQSAADNVDCDLVCVSSGWSPTVHLTSHLGEKPRYREDIAAFVAGRLPSGMFAAGALTGSFDMKVAADEGAEAGRQAAAYCGHRVAAEIMQLPNLEPDAIAWTGLMPRKTAARNHAKQRGSRELSRGKVFVDIQNDVTVDDIRLAHREGYRSVEHLKRYTTQGMGTDQGKTSNVNALALMAGLRGVAIPDVGTTTFRPPYTPVAIGVLAGRSVGHQFKPIRRTPMHDWHVENGAEMLEVGLWMRPWFYSAAGKTVDAASVAETCLVRESVGIVDISTLGKIDVQGPDAAGFLDRVYVNNWSNLSIGRARYGVMLRDDGIVLDDGTTTRLDEHRYFMTTSTAKAADVMSWLEFLLQVAWPDLRVQVTSVTDEWAAMSVAGPKSRDVMAAAFPETDVSNAKLPHMGALEFDKDGITIRLLRLSYSGERAYEVYVPASRGRAVWEHLLSVGMPFGLRAYGVEALDALRVEKGHVAGPEIDGRTTLADLGLERMASKAKPFVGQFLALRLAFMETSRPRLVGLEPVEPGKRLRPGAVLFATDDQIRGHGRGRVTSTAFSPTLGKWLGLGLYSGGMDHECEEIVAVYPIKDEQMRARIVSPVFLDPERERLRD